MKLKELLKDVNDKSSLDAKQLKQADDIQIHLKELIEKAKKEKKNISPVGGQSNFAAGLMSYGKNLYLYYDFPLEGKELNSTGLVLKKIE
jgi:hypothetical protein